MIDCQFFVRGRVWELIYCSGATMHAPANRIIKSIIKNFRMGFLLVIKQLSSGQFLPFFLTAFGSLFFTKRLELDFPA